MIPEDIFQGGPSVQSFWAFFTTILSTPASTPLTRAQIAKKMGVSPSIATKIVQKLQPPGFVSIKYDSRLEGTSKDAIVLHLSNIIETMAKDLGYNLEEATTIKQSFEKWVLEKKFEPNLSQLDEKTLELFKEPIFSDIAREFPIIFFSLLLFFIILSFAPTDSSNNEIDFQKLKPIPRSIIAFAGTLFVQSTVIILPYLAYRFLSPEAFHLATQLRSSDEVSKENLPAAFLELFEFSIDSSEMSQDDTITAIATLVGMASQQAYWSLSEGKLQLWTQLSSVDEENIDTDESVTLRIPLKSGDYHEVNIPSMNILAKTSPLIDLMEPKNEKL
ncbi:MAG: hypothetical protein ACE5OZ_01080 [Candidatus Heimdallarchaeota archaeon]